MTPKFQSFPTRETQTLPAQPLLTQFLAVFLAGALFALTLVIFAAAIIGTGKFIANHNFAIAKYAGEVSYKADDVDDIYPWVLDTEGYEHFFFDQKGAYNIYPFSRYEPRDGTFLQVFEVKLYNSKTGRLRLLRLIW